MNKKQINRNYEWETGNMIIERFRDMDPMHTPAVLVKNHGPFTWGADPFQAVENAVVLEQVAKMAAVAYSINPSLEMNQLLIDKHFERKHGPDAYYGQK